MPSQESPSPERRALVDADFERRVREIREARERQQTELDRQPLQQGPSRSYLALQNPADRRAAAYDMALPPEGNWSSQEDLLAAATAWGADHGWTPVFGKIGKDKSGKYKKGYLVCKRSGKPRKTVDERDRKRKHQESVKRDCPCRLHVREKADGRFYLRYSEDPTHNQHNHGPWDDPYSMPEHRKLSQEDLNLIKLGFATNVDSVTIVTQLADRGTKVTAQDVYNVRWLFNREERRGLSDSEALIRELKEQMAAGEIFFECDLDELRRIKRLFLIDAKSVAYLNEHPDVLLMDCTYKVSPLLHCISQTFPDFPRLSHGFPSVLSICSL